MKLAAICNIVLSRGPFDSECANNYGGISIYPGSAGDRLGPRSVLDAQSIAFGGRLNPPPRTLGGSSHREPRYDVDTGHDDRDPGSGGRTDSHSHSLRDRSQPLPCPAPSSRLLSSSASGCRSAVAPAPRPASPVPFPPKPCPCCGRGRGCGRGRRRLPTPRRILRLGPLGADHAC